MLKPIKYTDEVSPLMQLVPQGQGESALEDKP
jgi:hypothetical protein